MKINTEKNMFDNLSDEDVFSLEKMLEIKNFVSLYKIFLRKNSKYVFEEFERIEYLFNTENDFIKFISNETLSSIIEKSLYHFYKNKILNQNQNNNENIEYYNVKIDGFDSCRFLCLNDYDFNFKSYDSCLNFIQNLKPNVLFIENSINREGVDNYNKYHEEIIDHRNCDVTYMNQRKKVVHAVPKHQYKFDRIEFTDIINHQYNENEKSIKINVYMLYKGFQVWKELESIETEAGVFSREIDKEKIVQDWVVMKKPVKQIDIKISKKILEFKD